MARGGFILRVSRRGFEECRASLNSINEACCNAHIDGIDFGLETQSDGLSFNGAKIIALTSFQEAGGFVAEIRPTASMILFTGWLLTLLPSRATVTWHDGWPHVTCPPNDDREDEEGPAPQVPGECVPA